MYTVYKVTNNLTQDFYIGVHKTSNPMDDYLGSGKVIRQQVALHGPENFTKEILFCFSKKREAYEKEAELVDPLLGTPGCVNLHPGGHGGFGYINARGLSGQFVASQAAQEVLRERREDPIWVARQRALVVAGQHRYVANHLEVYGVAPSHGNGSDTRRGIPLSPTHRQAISKAKIGSMQGTLNSQHGTRWMLPPDQEVPIKVSTTLIPTRLEEGWVLGRVRSRTCPQALGPRTCSFCGAPLMSGHQFTQGCKACLFERVTTSPLPVVATAKQFQMKRTTVSRWRIEAGLQSAPTPVMPLHAPQCPGCGTLTANEGLCLSCSRDSLRKQIRDMHQEGAHHLEIADHLGITVRTVYNYLNDHYRASSLTQSPGLQIREASAQEPT